MYIKKIKINNFGPLSECKLIMNNKTNIIIGQNAVGKTHILYALYYLFNRDEAICVSEGCRQVFSIRIDFELDNFEYSIEKRYDNNYSQFIFNDLFQVSKISTKLMEQRIHFISGEALMENIVSLNEIEDVKKFLNSLMIKNTDIQFLKERIGFERLVVGNPVKIMSMGVKILLKLLIIFSRMSKDDILICDSIFSNLDNNTIDIIMNIIDKLPVNQTILLVGAHIKFRDNYKGNIQNIQLQNNKSIKIGCNYRYKIKDLIKEPDSNDDNIILTNYILNNILEEECKNKEFKEVKGNNPCSSIIKVAVNYVVAYLNLVEPVKGSILWGISDNRKVIGVQLDYSQRDEIRRKLCESFSQITPYISSNIYSIVFHQVYDDINAIRDRFILEVHIEKNVSSNYLYATPQNEVFVKTDGGRKKLSVQEVQEELMYRLTNNYVS